MRRAEILAWSAVALIAAASVAVLALDAGAGAYRSDWTDNAFGFVGALASTVVGLLLALRRPANVIGWLLLGNALVLVVAGSSAAYAGYALEHPGTLPGARAAAIWDTAGWPLLFAGLVAIALVFPDGRLPSRRWRAVVVGGVVSFLVTLAGGLLSGERLDEPFEHIAPLAALPDSVTGSMQGLGVLGMTVTLVFAMVALVRRFRGADGVLRLQLKWIAYAGVLIPVAIVVGTIDGAGPGVATTIAMGAVEVAIPIAIGIAVLRYRLYDIDRLISATLVYGVLTALLALGFVSISLGLGVALGGGDALPTAVATLAVAIAFRPLRARLQTLVDRRFNRARYEGRQRVDRFLRDLREGRAEPESVGDVLAEAVSDPTLRVFFWVPRDAAHADARGQLVPDLPVMPAGRTPVRRGELQLATLVHHPALLDRPAFLEDVIARAGLAIEIARLRVEVLRQLSEVEQSRSRIVAATYEERRRLERDLHDGAQQRLVSIGLDLRHLQHRLGPAAEETRSALDSAVASLAEAIGELRELARGVRPATLDGGLAPALHELAARAPIRTEVHVTSERFGQDLEAAAYFVASEALTNAIKHAQGTQVVLSANRANGNLVVSIDDDGCGGAAAAPDSGLTGLADRVAALGGHMRLRSDPGAGTSLVAEFPCASS